MKVTFYGNVLEYTDGEKVYTPEDCGTVRDLTGKLGIRYGKDFKDFLLGEETCFFLINGRGIMMTGGLDTPLAQDDTIEVLPFAEAG